MKQGCRLQVAEQVSIKGALRYVMTDILSVYTADIQIFAT